MYPLLPQSSPQLAESEKKKASIFKSRGQASSSLQSRTWRSRPVLDDVVIGVVDAADADGEYRVVEYQSVACGLVVHAGRVELERTARQCMRDELEVAGVAAEVEVRHTRERHRWPH
jgi:hypothetical protein